MKFCLGTAQFGMDYGIQGNGQPDIGTAAKMLNYAYLNGIDMLDTASAYGTAESVVGRVMLENRKLSKLNIVSKLEPTAFDKSDPSEWNRIAVRSAEESLKRLGISKLEAYLLHNSAYIFNPAAVEALDCVCAKGLAERIGVSVYTPAEAMKALEYTNVKSIQVSYNVFDQRLDKCGFFEKAKSQDVTVFARSSLLQGLVMMDPDRLPGEVFFARSYLVKYLEICDRYEASPLEAAVGYAGRNSGIDYVVFGVDSLNQLQQYIAIKNWDMPEKMFHELRTAFYDVEERLVNPSLWGKEE